MKNYAIDIVDERDFEVERLLGAVGDLPAEKMLSDDEIQNQRYSDPYGCVFFTGSSVSNTMNYIANESTRISGHELSKRAIEQGLLDPAVGALVISSPKLLLKEGYIKSYARCRSLQDIKIAICNNKPVQTGSNMIDREATKKNKNIAVRGSSYGHSFFGCGYSDIKEIVIFETSYGEGEFEKGYFFIKYEDIDLLFNSKYVMTDTPRKEYDESILEGIEFDLAKKGFKDGIWNGLDQNKSITRGEAVVMIMRALEK